MKKTIVFDFDGTLVKGDSLTMVFLEACSTKCIYKKLVYFFYKILSKFNIITVAQEKELAIELLFQNDKRLFEQACKEVANSLKLTDVINRLNEAIKLGYKVIILSASSEYLLEEFFHEKNVEIIATKFKVDNIGKIYGIVRHPYGKAKVDALKEHGYTHVDECYFDSKSDKCLEGISDKCFFVKP